MLPAINPTFNQRVKRAQETRCHWYCPGAHNDYFTPTMEDVMYNIPFGSERRVLLDKLITTVRNGRLPINAKWLLSSKHDKDIKHMVKSGNYRIISIRETARHKKQYLIKVN